jgi:hypothetical protein
MTPDTLTRELTALDDALAGRAVDPDLADLAELAVALRDERPSPDPAFTRTLDSRVERGFPRAAAKRRLGIKWPRLTLPALGVAASLLLVIVIAVSVPGRNHESDGGGSASSRSPATEQAPSDTSSDPSAAAPRAPSRSSGDSAASDAPAPSSPATSAPPTAALAPRPTPAPSSPSADRRGHRSVQRSAELVLAAPPREIDRAAAEILRVTDDLGGYVASSTVSSGSSGQFELRVPERRLQTALSRLSRVAKVRERTQSAQDITAAVVSVGARLKDARTERQSLLRQLAHATTPNQTSSIRARLRLVSGEIAADKRDLARVRTRASRSTISVSLLADRHAAAGAHDGGGWTPRDALGDAARILEVTAGVLLVALALALPLGLVALLVWLAARQAAQRRRERALDAV